MRTLLKAYSTSLLLIFFLHIRAQTELQIHQIDIGNGDGALIMLYDGDKLKCTIVIDGGMKGYSNNKFIPYLENYIPTDKDKKKKIVDWVIVSHNHQDHFKGVMELLKDKDFIVRRITDQGGYKIGNTNYNLPLKEAENSNSYPFITPKKGTTDPQKTLTDYVGCVAEASKRTLAEMKEPMVRYEPFDADNKVFKDTTIASIGGVNVSLSCLAANAFTRGVKDRDVGKLSPNNFSFGWLLEFGEFRFYTGGDLAGYGDGNYTDQETAMAEYLGKKFPDNKPLSGNTGGNYPGHVCVMKTDHHGSTHSSNGKFLGTLSSSVILTSAGKHNSWKIPSVEFVRRVADIPEFDSKRGVFFTELYNYSGMAALSKADQLFGSSAYDYIGSDKSYLQFSYKIVVKPENSVSDPNNPKKVQSFKITERSIFEVLTVSGDYTEKQQMKVNCHTF